MANFTEANMDDNMEKKLVLEKVYGRCNKHPTYNPNKHKPPKAKCYRCREIWLRTKGIYVNYE